VIKEYKIDAIDVNMLRPADREPIVPMAGISVMRDIEVEVEKENLEPIFFGERSIDLDKELDLRFCEQKFIIVSNWRFDKPTLGYAKNIRCVNNKLLFDVYLKPTVKATIFNVGTIKTEPLDLLIAISMDELEPKK
jgi:hypothetical protein